MANPNKSWGVSQSGLHTHPREKKYGNLWNQIDFQIKEGKRGDGKDGYNNITIGELIIGDTRIPLTFTECSKISDVLEAGKHGYKVSKSLGMTDL
jgi:hypothetical protein